MKTRIAMAGFAAALIGTASAANDKVGTPMGGVPGQWEYIGTVHAKHMGDHDTLIVAGPNNRFRALRFRVTDAPLRLHRMRVIYENGVADEIPVRFNIPKGGTSRMIDLRGGQRGVHQIDFWYDTKGWLRGTADVRIFGQH